MTDTPKPDTSDEAVERFDPFDYMIRSLEHGLNFSIKHSGRDPSDDTVMYTPPNNWTHGQIRAWIKAIKRASLDLDEQIMKANGLMLTRDRLQAQLTEAREKQRERELALIRHAREGGFGFMVSEEGILNAFNATQKEQG